ncbi:hypothetical protein [Salinactinospora qingdaonensis]|uniref:hypothetical protein n=1 Tax=Salinactinospora qingdaonensis TaxID=702744 RepID=UPI0031EA8491
MGTVLGLIIHSATVDTIRTYTPKLHPGQARLHGAVAADAPGIDALTAALPTKNTSPIRLSYATAAPPPTAIARSRSR